QRGGSREGGRWEPGSRRRRRGRVQEERPPADAALRERARARVLRALRLRPMASDGTPPLQRLLDPREAAGVLASFAPLAPGLRLALVARDPPLVARAPG